MTTQNVSVSVAKGGYCYINAYMSRQIWMLHYIWMKKIYAGKFRTHFAAHDTQTWPSQQNTAEFKLFDRVHFFCDEN